MSREPAAEPAAPPPAAAGMPGTHVVLAVLTVIIWGGNFVIIRRALDEVTPLLLATLRYLLSALPLMLVLPRPRVPWSNLAAYGLLVVARVPPVAVVALCALAGGLGAVWG